MAFRRYAALVAVAIALAGSAGLADDPAAEGKVTLARLRWGSDLRGFGRGFGAAWNHDYPRAEQHLSMIIRDITFLDVRTDADLVLKLDDPELFNHPISLMWEPGFWNLTDREAETFRAVPEYWEWSGQGMFPFDTSNEAYKLGVNYVIYAVTH